MFFYRFAGCVREGRKYQTTVFLMDDYTPLAVLAEQCSAASTNDRLTAKSRRRHSVGGKLKGPRPRWSEDELQPAIADVVIGYAGKDADDPPQSGNPKTMESEEVKALVKELGRAKVPITKSERKKIVWVARARIHGKGFMTQMYTVDVDYNVYIVD